MFRIPSVGRRCSFTARRLLIDFRCLTTNEDRARSYLKRHGLRHEQVPSETDHYHHPSLLHQSHPSLDNPEFHEYQETKPLRKELPTVVGNMPSVEEVVSLLRDDGGALNVVGVDVSEKAAFTNALVICSGRSPAHISALCERLIRELRDRSITVNGNIVGLGLNSSPDWKVVDAGFIVVHILLEPTRKLYDLEGLWKADVPPDSKEAAPF